MNGTRPLIILGGAGDLTGRLLLPSLAYLVEAGGCPPPLVAVAAEDLDDETYRAWASKRLDRHAECSVEACDSVVAASVFVSGNVTDPAIVRRALKRADANAHPPAIYLALPNAVFADTLNALAAVGVPDGTMIAVEKPFGADSVDAQRLNDILHRLVPESHAFRIDHFIAKRTVLNILGLRFANRLFEPLWSNQHIESVEIVYDETLALEGRVGYYDSAGALRDMLQNHLLQILALILMEPPRTTDAAALGAAKAEALRGVRTALASEAIRARYGSRAGDGQRVPAYADEDGVDPDRNTETYAELKLHVDTWRWAGVPFRLRTGKALSESRKEVCVHFRPVPHSPFIGPPPKANTLRLKLDTDAMVLELDINGEDDPFDLEPRVFATEPAPPLIPAYATVLAALLDGDSTLSISDIEAQESWRIVEGVLAAWAQDPAIAEYPAGSTGPSCHRIDSDA